MSDIFTGYVTKYALTSGILKVMLEETDAPGMVKDTRQRYATYYHGNDWWRTREDAVKRAEAMRQDKLKSLRKSIAKLEALDFGASNE